MGPIHNIINISKTDRNRAIRMYLMYLSDTWFYNTDDKYMFTYSDLMSLILIRYITDDYDINFELLFTDINYDTTAKKDTQNNIFSQILSMYNTDISELKSIIEHATFNFNSNQFNYSKLREFLISEFKKNDGFVHVDSYEFLVPYWTNILGYADKISNSSEIIKTFLVEKQEKTLNKMFIMCAGKETATHYDYNIRNYIVERMVKLHVLAIDDAVEAS